MKRHVGIDIGIQIDLAAVPALGLIVPMAIVVWIALWLVLSAAQNEAWAKRLLRYQAYSLGLPEDPGAPQPPLHALGRADAKQTERLT